MTSGHVRPLAPKDLEAVAALRLRSFHHSRYSDTPAIASQLRTVFLDNPWCGHGLESLVYETGHGDILAFGGLLPRPMLFCGQPLLAAVSSQIMVDPDARQQGIASALLRASLDGPQDFLFADLANSGYGHLLKQLGGVALPELGLQWRYPLRPLRSAVGLMEPSSALKWSLRVSRPVLDGLDRMAARAAARRGMGSGPPTLEELSIETHVSMLRQLDKHYDLIPEYDRDSLSWTTKRLAQALRGAEKLVARHVIDAEGNSAGFFVVALTPGATVQVIQFGSCDTGFDTTLRGVIELGRDNRCLDIKGRVQPEFLRRHATPPGSLSLTKNQVMMVADKPDLIWCLRDGRGFLTYLEGEMPLGF